MFDRDVNLVDISTPLLINSVRDYELFGLMARVRVDNPNGYAPRGFPADACLEVRRIYESMGVDAHSASWLTPNELLAVVTSFLTPDNRDYLPVLVYELENMRWRDLSADEFRIVFWFDN